MADTHMTMSWDTIYLFGLFLGRNPSQRDIDQKSALLFWENAGKVLTSKEFSSKERAFDMALPAPLLARDVEVRYQDWLRSKIGVEAGAPLYLGDRLVSDANRFDHMVLFCRAIEQCKGGFAGLDKDVLQDPIIRQVVCEGTLYAALHDPARAASPFADRLTEISAAPTLSVAMQELGALLHSNRFGAQIARLSYGATASDAAPDVRQLVVTLLEAAGAPAAEAQIHHTRDIFLGLLEERREPATLQIMQGRYHPTQRQLILTVRQTPEAPDMSEDFSLSLSSLSAGADASAEHYLVGVVSRTPEGYLSVAVPLPVDFSYDAVFVSLALGPDSPQQVIFIEGQMSPDSALMPSVNLVAQLDDMIVFRIPGGLDPEKTVLALGGGGRRNCSGVAHSASRDPDGK